MAVSIGPRIGIDGEAQYRKELSNIISQTKTLEKEMKNLSSSFDSSTSAEDKNSKKLELAQQKSDKLKEAVKQMEEMVKKSSEATGENSEKTEKWKQKLLDAQSALSKADKEVEKLSSPLEKLNNTISDQEQHLNELKDAYAKAFMEENKQQCKELSEQIEKESTALEKNKTKLASVESEMDKFNKKEEETTKETKETESAVDALSEALVASGLQQGLEKVAETLMDCINAAESFETATAKLQTIAGEENIESLSNDIMELSSATGIAAEDLSNTAYNAISAGTSVSDAVGMAETASKLAIAGFTDTDSALSVLTTALNSYGDSAGTATEISDSLIQVQNLGVTTVSELAANMGKAIATASAYSVNLSNLEAAYISTTKSGISTAESTTYISSMLKELGDSGSDVSGILQEQTGKSFGQLMTDGQSLGDVLQILYDNCNGDSEALMNLWGSAEAGKAANAILNQGVITFNTNLKTVQSSTGATEKAYETMADTGEKTGERLSNSITNLKIAIGKTLEPVLEGAQNAIGGVVEAVTDWVEKNPKLVKIITAAVTAIGILTVAITSYVAITKVAQIVTKAFSSILDSPTSKIGLMITAIAGVVAAISAFVAIAGDWGDAEKSVADEARDMADTLSSSTDTLNSSMSDIKSSFDETVGSAQVTADAARGAADELMGLAGQTSLTADEQQREAELVAQLNALYPEMGLAIDETTGALSMTNDEIEEYIDNMEQQAKAEAYYDAMVDAYKAVADAQKNVTDAEDKLSDVEDEHDRLLNEQQKIIDDSADGYAEYNGVMLSSEQALQQVNDAITDNEDAQKDLNDTLGEAQDALDEAQGTADDYADEYGKVQVAVDDATTAQEEATAAAEELSEEEQAAIDAIQEKFDTFKSTLNQPLESTWFDQLEVETDEAGNKVQMTASELEQNLAGQISAMTTWEQNMLTISGHVSDGVLEYLAEMGPEGAEYVQALADAVNSGDQEIIDKINSDWQQKVDIANLANEEGQQLATNVASAAASVQESMSGISTDTAQAAADAAANTSDVASSTEENLTEAAQSAQQQASAAKLNIEREFQEIPTYVGQKMNLAVTHVQDGVQKIANALNTTLKGPNIQVPHFSMSGAFDAKTNSVPTVNVSWYAKAMNNAMVFSSPSIIGVGEAGPEVVVGESHLADLVASAVSKAMGNTYNYAGTTVNVYGHENQSVEELANIVSKQINRELINRRGR